VLVPLLDHVVGSTVDTWATVAVGGFDAAYVRLREHLRVAPPRKVG